MRMQLASFDRDPWGYNTGYTRGMKTAVSVPDDLFRLAETPTRRLRISRSQLFATALAEYLERQRTSVITVRLNAECSIVLK